MSDPAGGLLWPLPFPQLAAMLDYWQAKRGPRRCPDKADIDPAAIPRLIPNIVLVDPAPDGGECRYRLAGTRATEMMGCEVRGRTLRELHNDTTDPTVLHEIARVELEFAWIALPLSEDGGRARHIIMIMVEIAASQLAVRKAGAIGFGIDLEQMASIPYPPDIVALSAPDYVWAWGAQP